jgi:hypothetical protein
VFLQEKNATEDCEKMIKRIDETILLEIFAANGTNRELSERFNTSIGTVSNIKQGRSWSSVTGKQQAPPPLPPPVPSQVQQETQIAQQELPNCDRELYDFLGQCTDKSGILDCLIEFASKRSLEPEAVKKNQNLLAKLTAECEANYILE